MRCTKDLISSCCCVQESTQVKISFSFVAQRQHCSNLYGHEGGSRKRKMRARFILLHKLETILFVLKVPMKMKWIHTLAAVSFSSDKSVQSRADPLWCMSFISNNTSSATCQLLCQIYFSLHNTGKCEKQKFWILSQKKVIYWVFFLYLGVKWQHLICIKAGTS